MIERMTECGDPLIDTDLRALETRLGVQLPTEYKAFLQKYNGGRPEPTGFPIDGLENIPYGTIQVLFRIGGPVECSTLDWN